MHTGFLRFSSPAKKQDGQAIVEYMLSIVLVLMIVTIFRTSMKSSILAIWAYYSSQITAACPGCSSNYRHI